MRKKITAHALQEWAFGKGYMIYFPYYQDFGLTHPYIKSIARKTKTPVAIARKELLELSEKQ